MKAIIINPAGGEVEKLYQYDKGCKIRFYIKNATDVIVDYSCTGMTEAATVEASADGDGYEAAIPDYVLEYGNNITCHIGYSSVDNRQIVDSTALTVERRTRPSGYISDNPGSALTAADLDEKKLDRYAGTEFAGKLMAVDENGEIVPVDSQAAKGEKGDKGDPGEKGDAGPQGEQGIQGPAGETGAQGEPGAPGQDGSPGADGKSAYEYAKEAGYTGSETDFATDLAKKPLTEEQINQLIEAKLNETENASY